MPNERQADFIIRFYQPDLLKHSSETLAGRIVFKELTIIIQRVYPAISYEKHWLRGGYPEALKQKCCAVEYMARCFLRTYIEKIYLLGLATPALTITRLLQMLPITKDKY